MYGFLIAPMGLAVVLMWLGMRKLRRRGRRSPLNQNLLREPGHSLDILRTDKAFDSLTYLGAVFALPFLFYASYSLSTRQMSPYIFVVIAVLIVAFCLFKAVTLFNQVIKLHQAVEAETATGQELNLLMRDGAWVFHDVPYQYGNIDHVIVSKGGVFAVETKGYSKPATSNIEADNDAHIRIEGDVLVLPGGRTKQPVTQALVHAKWLRSEIKKRFSLTVPVRAVLAFPGWMVNDAFENDCWAINPKNGNALRHAVTQNKIEEVTVDQIASWVEDLARSIVPKSKKFDSGSNKLFDSKNRSG